MDSRQTTLAADLAATSADTQQDKDCTPRQFALGLAFYFVVALVTLGWLLVPSNLDGVSAAGRGGATEPASQVPYFPSLHINQATDIEPPVATF